MNVLILTRYEIKTFTRIVELTEFSIILDHKLSEKLSDIDKISCNIYFYSRQFN